MSYTLSKWRFLCSLSGHVGFPNHVLTTERLDWLSYLEHVGKSLLNILLFVVRF